MRRHNAYLQEKIFAHFQYLFQILLKRFLSDGFMHICICIYIYIYEEKSVVGRFPISPVLRKSRVAARRNFSNELTLRVSCAFAASRNPFILGKTRILVKLSAETRASGSKPPSLGRERDHLPRPRWTFFPSPQ